MFNPHPIMFLAIVLVLFDILALSAAQCDQRKTGGRMLCCKGTDNSCYVRISSTAKKGQSKVCYCDEYCQTTGDCCSDWKNVQAECRGPQDCVVSSWSSWTKCSEQCGYGTMKRHRAVLQEPKNGGKPCPIKHGKKGCFQQKCKENMVLAQILPVVYRRPGFGFNQFDGILPDKKTLTKIQQIRKGFRSHCVNFKLMSKHPSCQGTWAGELKLSKPMCVECQPTIMDDHGFCKGEGIAGNFTAWVATATKDCSGLWMRVGEKIPNCECTDKKFQNFIFV